jgi:mediator of RNA polymerase II transcription subunit 21
MVTDLIVKAKQIEYLINSLPEPEPEEEQVSSLLSCALFQNSNHSHSSQAKRLQALEHEMEAANAEYIQAVNRASQFASL